MNMSERTKTMQSLDTPNLIRKAPENFLSQEAIAEINQHGADETRRGFLRKSFMAALGGVGAAGSGLALANPQGDPAILEKQIWQTTLGKNVATEPYGTPSIYEKNLIRRESPGLTRVSAASVAFTPLQGLFGIITPNGLHFERHHQGWYNIDPNKHRLMINGLVKNEKVFTMNDLMRLPSVSRIHFIECGANTGLEWGNVAVQPCNIPTACCHAASSRAYHYQRFWIFAALI